MKVFQRHGQKDGVFAFAGEKTYCQNGHHLGTFTRTVMCGDSAIPSDLKLEGGVEIGMLTCPKCEGMCAFKCQNDTVGYFLEHPEPTNPKTLLQSVNS